LGIGNAAASKSMEKLSSGYRINRAGDDAAGLAISEKMRGQIRGLNQASRNAQDGISLIQTAEGALNETHAILQRMRELAVQSATDTNTDDDRAKIQAEVDQLAKEITRISNTTEFNTQNLMAGGLDNTFHIGANQNQNVELKINAMDAYSLGVADSQIAGGAFTAEDSGIIGTSNYGRGLTEQTYSINTTATDAVIGVLNGTTSDNGTITGTYTGDDNITVQIRIDDVEEGKVTKFSYLLNVGSDWTEVDGASGTIGTTGLTWTADDSVEYQDEDKAKVIIATVTAAEYTAQLCDADGNSVGDAVTIRHSATSATIGDSSIGATMTITFGSGGIKDEENATQVITAVGSTKAELDGSGNVTKGATVAAGINVSSQGAADKAIKTINKALETVSSERSKLGAMQNRLEHTIKNLDTSAENLQASESRIRDVDMAKEMMEFTKNNILQQAAQAMLAQANQAPQGVLQLLR
jgi:flagellin